MRAILTAIVAMAALSSCSTPYLSAERPQYVPCGGTICLVGNVTQQNFDLFDIWGGGVRSGAVMVPLRKIRAQDFRRIEDDWVTDGRQVWCGRRDPLGASTDLRHLGDHFYELGGGVYSKCLSVVTWAPPNFKPVTADGFQALGCGLVRSAGTVYSGFPMWDGDQFLLYAQPIADPDSFVVDNCTSGHDERNVYELMDGRVRGTRPRG
jgi:hypothetical protein